jgi:hypothetical protein
MPHSSHIAPTSKAKVAENENARDSWSLRRLILEVPAVVNRPLRLRATVWPISGLHRQSTVQPRFPIDRQLASATISGSAFQLNRRLSSTARSFGKLSNRSPARAFNQSSNPASSRSFDLRLRSTFQLSLPIGLRLASPANLPACFPTDLQLAPSDQSSSSAFQFAVSFRPQLLSGSAFRT